MYVCLSICISQLDPGSLTLFSLMLDLTWKIIRHDFLLVCLSVYLSIYSRYYLTILLSIYVYRLQRDCGKSVQSIIPSSDCYPRINRRNPSSQDLVPGVYPGLLTYNLTNTQKPKPVLYVGLVVNPVDFITTLQGLGFGFDKKKPSF